MELLPKMQSSKPAGVNLPDQAFGKLENLARSDAQNLYYFILKRVGDPHEAEDLMQETFEVALRSIKDFRGDCKLRTWVYGIATNLLRNHLSRSPGRLYEFDSDDALEQLLSEDASPEEKAHQTDWLTKLDYCLEQLSEEMRLTIMTVLIEDASYVDAARVLDVPVGTIRSRICRARKILKEKIEGVPLSAESSKATVLPREENTIPSYTFHPLKPTEPVNVVAANPVAKEIAFADKTIDQTITAYRCLEEKRVMLNNEIRKGLSRDDFVARQGLLAVIESALEILDIEVLKSDRDSYIAMPEKVAG